MSRTTDRRRPASSPLHRRAVPASPNALIGREAEVAVVCRRLRERGVRLVTLTGPAGVGKTRLALAVAEALFEAFDHVAIVALAAIREPALVLPAIAKALGLRLARRERIVDGLAAFLGTSRTLLLLDNFEQVLEAAPLVAELLTACPTLTLLVTSRAALRLRWEHQSPVLPLALPDPRRDADLHAIAAAPAVALFVERARAVQPGFALTAGNAAAVAAICRRLDGLPLAIELAAARAAVLSPRSLLERLQCASGDRGGEDVGPLAVLSAGARDLPDRQQTLRRAIGWSYDLLSPGEQSLLRCLCVCIGGCTLAAAGAVCGAAGAEVLGGIAALVDASLLQRDEAPDGETRLHMLELIRAFALERLEHAGELDRARQRHALFYRGFVEVAGAGLEGPEQASWLERLDRDLDNLRAAFAYATGLSDGGELALQLVLPLAYYWEVRGYYHEGRTWLDTALTLAGNRETRERARALSQLGAMALREGDRAAGRADFEQSLALFRALGDRAAAAHLLNNLALLALIDREFSVARALFDECEALCRELGDGPGVAMALNNRGLLEKVAGNLELASRYLRECVALSQASGYTHWLAFSLLNLGWVTATMGDLPAAAVHVAECVRLCRSLGFRLVLAHAIAVSGMVADRERRPVRATRLLAASTALLAATGSGRDEPIPQEVDRLALRLRAELGEGPFATAWAEGSAMSADEAVACALSVTGQEPIAGNGSRPAPDGSSNVRLTAREAEVLRLAAAGYTSREIASQLVLSERTVENHLFRVYARIGARGRADAVAYAIRHGLA